MSLGFFFEDISFDCLDFILGERNGSLSLAGSETSSLTAPSTTRARRNSTTKIIDNRPKHLMLGDFELANVV